MKKRIYYSAVAVLMAVILGGTVYLNSLLPIITGYAAKYLCSAVFVSNRTASEVESAELNFSFIQYVTSEINYRDKSITSHFLWGSSKAIYREGLGSTLLRDTDEGALRKKKIFIPAAGYNPDTIAWPLGNIIPAIPSGEDTSVLRGIAKNLICRKSYRGNAFAFLVVHHGIPVAEQYKQGFTAASRFQSWSIAKSFTNALTGIMVKDGKLDIHQRAGIAAWQNDDRKNITISNLLQMESGLRWNEDYGNRSDVTMMLYNSNDFAGFAFNKPMDFPAGCHWYYSSGSANIVNYLIRKQFKDEESYDAYAPARLFYKIGITNAVFETDPSGTQVGSSYIYATARDYARFGLLFLQDGVFNGERILPEGWVSYSTTPAAHSNGSYGSLFWLNSGNYYRSAPKDMYFCNGHDGQRIFIIPSRDLVIVVLGYSPKPDNELNFNQLLNDILGSLNDKNSILGEKNGWGKIKKN